MRILNWLINWFRNWIYIDSPQIPWRWGQWEVESLFDNPHTRPLAEFLSILEPQLLAQWYASVAPAAAEVRKAAIALEELLRRKDEVLLQLATVENTDASPVWKNSHLQIKNYWEWLLTIGLSLMLFLGIAETLRIEMENLAPEQWPLFCLALLGAICLTAGAKLMVIRWVKATRSYEPKRSFFDCEGYANPVAFWSRIISGDSAVWLSIAIVLLEITFAGPGFIRLLPFDLRKQLLIKFSAFMGTGIAALTNVGLAWGTALNEIRLEQELTKEEAYQLKSEWQKAQERKFETRRQAEAVKVVFKEIAQEIEEQKRLVKDLKKRAQLEHERWEAAVKRHFRRWLNAHPKRWERFKQFYNLYENRIVDSVLSSGKQTLSRNIGEMHSDGG
ncbi:MAG: hypothetical protein N2235_01180 [Fischerella sp.]|nr:hypothetical protein [Fischerella sp.]